MSLGARKYEIVRRTKRSIATAASFSVRYGPHERGEILGGDPDRARQALDGELAEHLARLGTEHDRQVLVGTQFAGRRDDQPNDEVLEIVDTFCLGGQTVEELGQLAHLQRAEQDLLATGKQAVQRGS